MTTTIAGADASRPYGAYATITSSFLAEVALAEHPIETGGARQAIGELVTCTRCVGAWAALSLVATEALAPRFGRVLIRYARPRRRQRLAPGRLHHARAQNQPVRANR